MDTPLENTLLIELQDAGTERMVLRIIRSYLYERRAMQDLALLREINPDKVYDTITVEHIDD